MAKRDLMVNRKMQIAQVAPVIGDTRVDVWANLSRLNHRMYRQGMTYSVKVDLEPTSTQTVDVYALNPNWITKRAWQMAYEVYLNSTAEERDLARKAGIAAKWHDFRVDTAVAGAGAGLPLVYDENRASAILSAGEFNGSTVGSPDSPSGERAFTVTGTAGATTYNIFDEFDLVYRPDVSVTDIEVETNPPYDGLTADSDINALEFENEQDNGNLPPYQRSVYQNAQPLVKIAQLKVGAGNGAQGTGRLTTGFFDAPLGLVILENYAPTDTDSADCIIEVQAGDYKGVKATPLGMAKKTGKHQFKVV